MRVIRWFRHEFIPWTRGRMFRTGVPLDQEIEVSTQVVTVANGITLIRIIGLPVFVYLALGRHAWLIAFVLFGILAVLDSIDGYVARRFNQSSKLGSAMDPLTDRITVVTLGVTLVVAGVFPVWLMILVVLRDVLLLALFAIYSKLGRPAPVRRVPITRIGKLANMTLLTCLPFLLLARTGLPGRSAIHAVALVLSCAGIILYYVGFGQYLRAGSSGRADQPA